MKEIKEYLTKLSDFTCSWDGRLNNSKISVLPKFIHKVNTILFKIPSYFVDFKNSVEKFIQKSKNPEEPT